MKLIARSILAAVAGLLAACAPEQKRPTANGPVPVEVARVEERSVPVDIPTIGTAEAMATVQLKSRVQGAIIAVHFEEGALVKEGQILFSMDPRSFDVAVARAQANVAAAQANFENASQQLARYASLTGQGAASKEQLAQFRSTADALMADMQAKQADLAEAKLSREWTEVKAPISGRIGAALFKVGSIVQANSDTLAVIHQIQPIHVAFSVPESQLPAVREAAHRGSLVVLVHEPTENRELGHGTLDFIDNAVDRNTGTIGLKARLENQDEALWPGQFVDVTLRLAMEENQRLVPTTAIMDGQQGARVLVVENQKAVLRDVSVSRTFGIDSIVSAGLEPGETVIRSGQLRVVPGAPVSIKEAVIDSPPPSPQGASANP